jgi:hypothetical protein
MIVCVHELVAVDTLGTCKGEIVMIVGMPGRDVSVVVVVAVAAAVVAGL